ncbi:hypothetical protein ES703_116928 [subsurface metagenome]
MVEFNLKIHPEQRVGYFKKELVNELGTDLKILSAGRAFVAYPKDEDLRIVIRSVEIILDKLKGRVDILDKKFKEEK